MCRIGLLGDAHSASNLRLIRCRWKKNCDQIFKNTFNLLYVYKCLPHNSKNTHLYITSTLDSFKKSWRNFEVHARIYVRCRMLYFSVSYYLPYLFRVNGYFNPRTSYIRVRRVWISYYIWVSLQRWVLHGMWHCLICMLFAVSVRCGWFAVCTSTL